MARGFLLKSSGIKVAKDFLRRFFREELPKLGSPKTDQDAFDHFYRAASGAAQSDLDDFLIKRLRWPVSETVRAEVAANRE